MARCEVICELITVRKYVQAQESGMMLELADVLLNLLAGHAYGTDTFIRDRLRYAANPEGIIIPDELDSRPTRRRTLMHR